MTHIAGLTVAALQGAVRTARFLLAALTFSVAVHASEPSLTGNYWSIVVLNGKPVRGEATMNFTRFWWLGLTTPCGVAWGWYRQSGKALSVHIAGGGKWAVDWGGHCVGFDYQLLLGRVRTFTLNGDRLLFWDASGRPIARLVRKQ